MAGRDLQERTFEFSRRIVTLCMELDKHTGVGRTLGKQMLRSGISIGANVEEAQGSQSRADFIAKTYIACKEARETHYWLRLMAAPSLLPTERLEPLTIECNELIAILTAIVKKTRENTRKG